MCVLNEKRCKSKKQLYLKLIYKNKRRHCNPISRFNGNYQSKLIEKVKNNFTNYEQQLFISSFYCYLNYDYKNDFVIDLDNVWKWLGFSQKVKAKS